MSEKFIRQDIEAAEGQLGVAQDFCGDESEQGAAYVFVKSGGSWETGTETGKLTASDGVGGDFFGNSVAISGDTAVVGAYENDGVGAAYLFAKIGMESGIAVSMSLINFLFMVMVGLVGGFIYVYTLSVGRIQYYTSDAVGAESVET